MLTKTLGKLARELLEYPPQQLHTVQRMRKLFKPHEDTFHTISNLGEVTRNPDFLTKVMLDSSDHGKETYTWVQEYKSQAVLLYIN